MDKNCNQGTAVCSCARIRCLFGPHTIVVAILGCSLLQAFAMTASKVFILFVHLAAGYARFLRNPQKAWHDVRQRYSRTCSTPPASDKAFTGR